MKNFISTLIILFIIISCEDKIDVALQDVPPIVVIDAWINNQKTAQKVTITKSQQYFDSSLPIGIANANIRVINSRDQAVIFTPSAVIGEYTWDANTDPTFIEEIGESYLLEVTLSDGTRYTAQSQINRVPEIDSIKFTFKEEDGDGYEGEFLATDFEGEGDTYWIKAFKNGRFLNSPFELNIAYDAGFSPGIDGVVFIQPIQSGVHELDDDAILSFFPYELGDSLCVELHSISNEAYDFLEQVRIQTQRNGGFDEIFAVSFGNVPTNITSSNPDEQLAGFFSVAAVNVKGRKLE